MQISIDPPVLISSENLSIQPSEFYEAAIAVDETIVCNYWYLGVSYLLAGREDDAQAAWFVPLAAATEAEIDIYTGELVFILAEFASYRAQLEDLESAWLIRQHLWMLQPANTNNILQLIVLANSLDRLTEDILIEWQVNELLSLETIGNIEDILLEDTISALISAVSLV